MHPTCAKTPKEKRSREIAKKNIRGAPQRARIKLRVGVHWFLRRRTQSGRGAAPAEVHLAELLLLLQRPLVLPPHRVADVRLPALLLFLFFWKGISRC